MKKYIEEREKEMYWEWGVWGDSTVYIFVLFIIFFPTIAEKIIFVKRNDTKTKTQKKNYAKEKIPNIPGV